MSTDSELERFINTCSFGGGVFKTIWKPALFVGEENKSGADNFRFRTKDHFFIGIFTEKNPGEVPLFLLTRKFSKEKKHEYRKIQRSQRPRMYKFGMSV